MDLFHTHASFGSDIMEERKTGNNLTKGLPEAKRGAFSRRSVLTLVGTLGAAAPFGIFGAARALTAPGAGSLSYIPGELPICRTAATAKSCRARPASSKNRLERERGLHGRCAGRKERGISPSTTWNVDFVNFGGSTDQCRGDCDWQGGCRFGVGPALAQAAGARFRRSDHRRCHGGDPALGSKAAI